MTKGAGHGSKRCAVKYNVQTEKDKAEKLTTNPPGELVVC